MWCLWAAKGGSGCSVVAASAALRATSNVLLVDLAGGDLSTILGVDDPEVGLVDWLHQRNPPPDGLTRLEVGVRDRIRLLPFGGRRLEAALDGQPAGHRCRAGASHQPGDGSLSTSIELLARILAFEERPVVIDLGCVAGPTATCPSLSSALSPAFLTKAARSTLVTRLCYLGVRRAMELPPPDDVIVVTEPDRALRPPDVAKALGVSNVVSIRSDPSVARAVDAGLLAVRLPRPLRGVPLGQSVKQMSPGTELR